MHHLPNDPSIYRQFREIASFRCALARLMTMRGAIRTLGSGGVFSSGTPDGSTGRRKCCCSKSFGVLPRANAGLPWGG